MASGFSLENGYGVKVLGVVHIIIGGFAFGLQLLVDPIALMFSGIPYVSFQLFLLGWWLWRVPRVASFRQKMLPISLRQQPITTEQEEQRLLRTWRSQLLFIILWGWMCTIFFGSLAIWWMGVGGYFWGSVLLLGGFFTAIAGWVLGSGCVVHRVYRQ